jgi:hypothetical protein
MQRPAAPAAAAGVEMVDLASRAPAVKALREVAVETRTPVALVVVVANLPLEHRLPRALAERAVQEVSGLLGQVCHTQAAAVVEGMNPPAAARAARVAVVTVEVQQRTPQVAPPIPAAVGAVATTSQQLSARAARASSSFVTQSREFLWLISHN